MHHRDIDRMLLDAVDAEFLFTMPVALEDQAVGQLKAAGTFAVHLLAKMLPGNELNCKSIFCHSEVLSSSINHQIVVAKLAYAHIAGVAEEASDQSRAMVVINDKLLP